MVYCGHWEWRVDSNNNSLVQPSEITAAQKSKWSEYRVVGDYLGRTLIVDKGEFKVLSIDWERGLPSVSYRINGENFWDKKYEATGTKDEFGNPTVNVYFIDGEHYKESYLKNDALGRVFRQDNEKYVTEYTYDDTGVKAPFGIVYQTHTYEIKHSNGKLIKLRVSTLFLVVSLNHLFFLSRSRNHNTPVNMF